MLFIIYILISLAGSGWFVYRMDEKTVLTGILFYLLYFIGLYLLCVIFHLLVFAIMGYTIRVDNLPKSIHTIYRWYGFESLRLFMGTLHIRIHMHGMEKMPVGQPFLLVSNHRSIFDPLVGLIKFEKYDLAFVSKQENLKIPFVGRFMAAVGCLPLDRENAKNALQSIRQTAENIKSGYANYGIYPEGWENKTSDPLLPFRSGAFKIAKSAGCQIVLSTIRNSDHIFRRAFTFRPIHIHVDVLGIIPAEEVKAARTNELSERAAKVLTEFLTEHPADVYLSAKG